MTSHDHAPEGDCQPSCPAWSEGALELGALLRRYDAMLAACQAAERIEYVVVAPATPGVDLPESLKGEDFVRLNLVVGRDCPEVLLDAWGIRVTLTFRGRRHDCAFPWPAVKTGVLTAPRKRVRKFGVVDGGAATPSPQPSPPRSGGEGASSDLPLPSGERAPSSSPPLVSGESAPSPDLPLPSGERAGERGASKPTLAPAPAPEAPDAASLSPSPTPRPRPVFGVIRGGRADGEGQPQ